ncbi:MAG: major facilitator superfamily 1 [Modestobacter sp.]|jgi:AAHS family benzoate transporter-like MFS transporter|nr:major facilitator superfamily 1 [Modestobacter sp.]
MSMPSRTAPAVSRTGSWVAALCWTAVLLDGFDLVVVGTVVPTLRTPQEWALTEGGATFVVTIGLVGMTIGALTIGALTDVLGRRAALIAAVTSFSVFTMLCALAPDAGVFGLLRFLAGLGLGGCLPTAIAMVNEFTRRASGRATTTMMTGYHVGAVITSALAIVVLEHTSWRWMFVIGGLPAVVLIPLMVKNLPESPAFLLAHGRRDEAERIAAQHGLDLEAAPTLPTGTKASIATLFTGGRLRTTLALGVTSFMGLLLVYGLNGWLPTIMREAHYDLGAALAFLLVLNLGAIAGLLLAGRVAQRTGSRSAGIVWFAAGAVFLALLSVRLPIAGIYVMVFLTGCFVFSAQVLVYAFTSANHPPQVRATALGWAAGVGRVGAITGPLIGGALLSAGIAFPWGFYVFAVVGALGALALAVTRVSRERAVA